MSVETFNQKISELTAVINSASFTSYFNPDQISSTPGFSSIDELAIEIILLGNELSTPPVVTPPNT